MSRIIVKNLPDKITKEKLNHIFSAKGVITDIQLKYTKDGVFRKFAFIGFQKPEEADAAKTFFNKSFINTSQIQVEICTELGDPKKPRAWSKYAHENLKRSLENIKEEPKVAKIPKLKGKIKDPKVLELLKNYENDQLFKEFLDVNAPEMTADLDLMKNTEYEGREDEEKELAKKDVSDSAYLKLKTGINLNFNARPRGPINGGKAVELFTVKLSGLPCRVKKSQIKEFLNPLKPFTIRRALKIKGVAYCGFKTEKEMKTAVFKNRSFLSGKRIFVTPVKNKKSLLDKKTEEKWKAEEERLKGLETVAESGRIFIRNLPYTVMEEDLKAIFEKYGAITDFILPIDSFTRRPKGFGIVTFLIPENACRAFNELDGTIFQGRMLHLLPALPKKSIEEEDDDISDDPFKKKKRKKEKAKSDLSNNWNTFFIGENALAEAMADTYNTTKENVLDDKKGGTSVRLALGETQIISKMKEFLEENDVCLEAFDNMLNCPRSKTVILVKNLPFGTKETEIRDRFSKFGDLKRMILPPSGVAALVEYIEPSEAKAAFRRLAYSKFKHIPMYLEWAPEAVFRNKEKPEDKIVNNEKSKEKMVLEKKLENVQNHFPVEGAILFVKNLNFSTDEEALRNHFSSCGKIISATIARKKNRATPCKMLSMGYGFVEFGDKESADNALKTLQFSTLDNYRIELKRSHRTLSSDPSSRMNLKSNNKPSTTILVRNIPFQATSKEIADIFKVFGEIKSVRLPKKMVGTGIHRGFCFVEYNTFEDAKRAFGALSQSTHFYGRRLVLEWASIDDDDIATLRLKTAKQFKTGTIASAEKKKNITIEKIKNEEEEE